MEPVKLNIPATSNIEDERLRTEITQIVNQIRTLVSTLNEVVEAVNQLRSNP